MSAAATLMLRLLRDAAAVLRASDAPLLMPLPQPPFR